MPGLVIKNRHNHRRFLLFSATALVILANMGQLTHNMVARNIRIMKATVQTDALSQFMTKSFSNSLGQGLGLREQYSWGLYNYCGGSSDFENVACEDRSFGHRINLPEAIKADLPEGKTSAADGQYSNQDNINRYTRAAFYLLFVGTIIAGVAFIVSVLIHMAALSIASILSFLAFAVLVAGAGIETYFIANMKDNSAEFVQVDYGNALWMFWAAAGACLVSIPLLVGGAAASRVRYAEVY
ncbi:hypothetical protein MCAP1_003544 [Malassezia caprae]|uniref:Uncharacterized protein n=1 Tax=Malassezia caprae TaxID=1381934 RepID=A0AAF0E8T7_9BASI|nr:hypothetical protein MCAP1_003544 [Malassezia caprae]